MSAKLDKLRADIERTRTRRDDIQARLESLEKQFIDMENSEIVMAVRDSGISSDKLADYIRLYQAEQAAGVMDSPPLPETTDESPYSMGKERPVYGSYEE